MYSFLDWIDAVRYRWKLVALVTGVIGLLAILYIGTAPRKYTASASLLLDSRAPDPIKAEDNPLSPDQTRNAMATQADLIRSPNVATQAAVIAGYDKNPGYVQAWQKQTSGRQPYGDWLAQVMLGQLSVTPGKDTDILEIRGTAKNAKDAAQIANAFAQASVDSQYRLRTQPARAYSNWLAGQLTQAKGRVIEAQNTLSDFVKQTGITNDNAMSTEGTQMAEMVTQLASAEAKSAAARQSNFSGAQARGDAERSQVVQGIRQQISETSGKLADLQAMFGPDYPDVKRTQAQLSTLQSKLNSELSNASGTFSGSRNAEAAAERAAAAASENRLRSLTSQQNARMMKMGTNFAQYNRLKNEFDTAQRNYNDLDQRLTRMRLQGNVPLTDVQVLDHASPPLFPSSPKVGMTMLLALLLGAILGTIAAIVLEFINPRVRSWGGIERRLGVQVVGRIALPRPGPVAISGPAGPRLLEGASS
ncbi:hypothetical protein HMF7854_15105 [Sphingomonas ginkgonis]|uniref:Tyrosine-protein kinase G-rich domain-containing protein n=1 Tax=Sphingomonas ginkgonis TaxID=2315330 RepID=A0A3R9YP97_9SPHN|nr:GNVR domain-containing protein [Sphingomonas ginkgonis]RST32020.1 hypothetical protein HMF7854_15105 [Sphingomonas ginkgonis]